MVETLFLVAGYAVAAALAGAVVVSRWPVRAGYLAGAFACAGLIGVGLYSQHVMLLDPCPLCILQRIVFIALMAIYLVAAAHGPGRGAARVYATLLTVAAGVGAAIAARQVWLQHLPADRVPECGPGLDYLLNRYSWQTVLEKVLRGSGECADPGWMFLGLSIAGWALVWFLLLAALGIFLCFVVSRRARTFPGAHARAR